METMELQSIIRSIPADKQNLFLMEYNANKKNPPTAVLLAVLLGGFGAHHFYLGNIIVGVIYLLFSWTGATYVIAWVEALFLSAKVQRKNLEIARETAAILSGKININL